MILALILLVAFQLPDSDRRMEELRRMSEIAAMTEQSKIRLAQQSDIQYREALLLRDHQEFVQKFNDYLAKYHQGIVATKEIRECVRAWEKLRNNPDSGFDHAKH